MATIVKIEPLHPHLFEFVACHNESADLGQDVKQRFAKFQGQTIAADVENAHRQGRPSRAETHMHQRK
jgi:hypothetical protein